MMGWRPARIAAVALALLFAPAYVYAHSLSLSVLTLEEVASGQFIVSWEHTHSVSDPSLTNLLLKPQFPPQCRFTPPKLDCGVAGLSGQLGLAGLGELSVTGMVHVRWQSGQTQSFTLSAAEPSVRIVAPSSTSSAMGVSNFLWVGLEHIWLGWDHLLFVLGLFWLVRTPRMLVKTISAFTLAHSLTLCAATFGYRWLDSAPVEAVIALSIAFVAVEIAHEARTGEPSFTGQHPWLVAFAFGLLHGFGFASALAELQLAPANIPAALLCFNVGVEVGQLAFVLLLFALRYAFRRLGPSARERGALVGYYAMGGVAMYWFFERVSALGQG